MLLKNGYLSPEFTTEIAEHTESNPELIGLRALCDLCGETGRPAFFNSF